MIYKWKLYLHSQGKEILVATPEFMLSMINSYAIDMNDFEIKEINKE